MIGHQRSVRARGDTLESISVLKSVPPLSTAQLVQNTAICQARRGRTSGAQGAGNWCVCRSRSGLLCGRSSGIGGRRLCRRSLGRFFGSPRWCLGGGQSQNWGGGVGEKVIFGLDVGLDVGLGKGLKVGDSVGCGVGMAVGESDRAADGVVVGLTVGGPDGE